MVVGRESRHPVVAWYELGDGGVGGDGGGDVEGAERAAPSAEREASEARDAAEDGPQTGASEVAGAVCVMAERRVSERARGHGHDDLECLSDERVEP